MEVCACHGVEKAYGGRCRVKQREYDRRYRRSPRGRSKEAAFDASPQGRVRHKRYTSTPRGSTLERLSCRRSRQPQLAKPTDLNREYLLQLEAEQQALDNFIETGVSPWK